MTYTPTEAAAICDMHPESIRRLIRSGELATTKDDKVSTKAVASLCKRRKAAEARRQANREALATIAQGAKGKAWLTRTEAAGIIGCSARTVDRLIVCGELPVDEERKAGARPCIKRASAKALAKKRSN